MDDSSPLVNRSGLSSALSSLRIDAPDSRQASDETKMVDDTTPPAQTPESPYATIRGSSHVSIEPCEKPGKAADDGPESGRYFQKWMRSLHRKAKRRPSLFRLQQTGAMAQSAEAPSPRPSIHRQSSSGSSFGFVTAVRSASVSLASVSIIGRSRRNAPLSQCVSRSSRASLSGPRISEDSAVVERNAASDAAAVERSLQRRRVLEELISTEEAYIGDVRFLMNVYVTILASLPTVCMGLRSSINQNLAQIIELHEELLGELHQVVPHSEYTQPDFTTSPPIPSQQSTSSGVGHRQRASLDAVRQGKNRTTWLHNTPGMLAEPQVAADVSKVFAKKMKRFFVYEEYGAKHDMMIKDVGTADQEMPQWNAYQRGIEALASILGSAKSSEEVSKRALTIGDLLVKPIQRICKYPLLFAELLKCTPVSDCPNSHMQVEDALTRLREATAEINRATNSSKMKATLERTWLLQDRLVFPNKRLDADAKDRVRSFGQIQLCGTLHVCWQCSNGVQGRYLICLLYSNVLCLATAGRADPVYIIQACILLERAKVEDVDNGRGLQCHTAPFSWKLVFEYNYQLYEVVMTACTPKEEMEWRTRLTRSPAEESEMGETADTYSCLDLNMKSLGTVFGRPDTVARRMSIQRATTLGPRAATFQVWLKNTSVVRDTASSASMASTLSRSQSMLLSNSRVSVLAPARSERAKLEALLSDVWSREVLPFPVMTTRARSEHLVRTSASTVMRKLSVASITSSFSRRSGSTSQKSRSPQDSQKVTVSKRRAWKSLSEDAGTDCDPSMEPTPDRGSKRPRTGQTRMRPGQTAGEVAATRGIVRRSKTVTERVGTRTKRASSTSDLQCSQMTQPAATVTESDTQPEAEEAQDATTGGRSRRGKAGSLKNLFR